MYDDVPRKQRGLELPVCAKESLYLRPGEVSVVKIEYVQTNPQREALWAGRGKRWVTEILFGVRSWATAVRVVNVSDRNRLILESTESRQGWMRAERLEQLIRLRDPPAVPRPEYQWPTKLLVRPKSQDAEVRMVQLQERPEVVEVFLAARRGATPKPEASVTGERPDRCPEPSTTGAIVGSTEDAERFRNAEDLSGDLATFSRAKDPECHPTLKGVLESALDDFSNPMDDISDISDTPVQRLEREYERVMRVTVEELDLEPTVYLREGTELLAQLSDHLTMFPELEELSPECDIDKADVGVPGVTTPEMEDKMRKILNYHRRSF
ncbi:Aspartic protease [Phytophthora megakarya]|uniref:Aspartic protease n=1 Tax=Phytophthora megakarya TaxID=4795 RepID=A0A225UYY7_9STRA|nr:Aspartic protease [Phytophthora megakarya]